MKHIGQGGPMKPMRLSGPYYGESLTHEIVREVCGLPTRAWLWIVAVVAYIAIVVPAFVEFHREGKRLAVEFYQTVPDWTADQVVNEIDRLQALAHSPSANPEDYYWGVLEPARQLHAIARKVDGGYSQQPWDMKFRMITLRTSAVTQAAQDAYQKKYGQRVMAAAGEEFRIKHPIGADTHAMAPMFPVLRRMYLASLPFAAFFFLLSINDRGLLVWVEVVQAWRLALATLFWPIMVRRYPDREPVQQLATALRFMALIVGTCVSGFAGGVVKAAEKTGDGGSKKDKRKWGFLQTDARTNGLTNGETLALGGQFRATLTRSDGLIIENVTVARQGFWLNSATVGKALIARPNIWKPTFQLNVNAGTIFNSAGAKTAQTGAQVFYTGRRFYSANPVLNWEHQFEPVSTNTLAGATQTGIRLGSRIFVGGDGSVRYTFGKPTQWSVGPHIGMKIGRASFVEVALLRDQQHDRRLRLRWKQNWLYEHAESDNDTSSAFKVNVSMSSTSRYMGVIGMAVLDGPVVQPSVTVTHRRSGFYANVWHSYSPAGGGNSDYGDEVDYTIGRTGHFGKATVDVGLIHLDVQPLGRIHGDVRNFYANTSINTTLKPYARVDWILGRNPQIVGGGLHYRLGVRPVFRQVTLDASVAGHDGMLGFPVERVSSARLKVSRDFKLGHLAVSPFVAHQVHLGNPGGIAPTRTWAGVNFNYAF